MQKRIDLVDKDISDFCRVPLFHYLSVSYHLAITGNSAASERTFSETGRLVEARHLILRDDFSLYDLRFLVKVEFSW
jgi:hypothetical protein